MNLNVANHLINTINNKPKKVYLVKTNIVGDRPDDLIVFDALFIDYQDAKNYKNKLEKNERKISNYYDCFNMEFGEIEIVFLLINNDLFDKYEDFYKKNKAIFNDYDIVFDKLNEIYEIFNENSSLLL